MIKVHPEAVQEARAAFQWYQPRSKKAAEFFLAELDHVVKIVQENPLLGPVYLCGTRRYLLRRFPFFVVYRQAGNELQIVAVAHARRRPGYWRHR